jgi:PAS domain-containing protein
VIVLTAQPAHKLRALQTGAKDFISKPFELLELQTRIYNMLEVRLLHRQLETHNLHLEHTVQARTAELRESHDRFRSLAELATDWYWELGEHDAFTLRVGLVPDMLGLNPPTSADIGWDPTELAALRAKISERQGFLDLPLHHKLPSGELQLYRVSGEPILDRSCRVVGFRGIGVLVPAGY